MNAYFLIIPQRSLMLAFYENDIVAFLKALKSSSRADPNLGDPNEKNSDQSIFEKVLETPNSTLFIEACIEYGADLYQVRKKN